jgi:hypothetical protein
LGTTLTPVYAALAAWKEDLGQPAPQKARKSKSANPDPVLRGQGLHVEPIVERTVRCANPLVVQAETLSLT